MRICDFVQNMQYVNGLKYNLRLCYMRYAICERSKCDMQLCDVIMLYATMRCQCDFAMRLCYMQLCNAIMQCDYVMQLCNAIMLHAIIRCDYAMRLCYMQLCDAIMRCDYATCNLCHAIMHIYKKQKKLLQRSALNDFLKVSASSTTQHDGSSRGRQ